MAMRWALALLAATGTAASAAAPAADGWRVDRVVVLMRHGVRPPTKDPALPAGTTAQPWPRWPVPPGWLTPHGAAAIGRVAAADRAAFVAAGVLPARGCPTDAAIRLIADSDQRTIATADAYRAVIAPGCSVTIDHRPQGERDPIFSPTLAEAPLDPEVARAAVLGAAGPGGIAAVEQAERPGLARLDAILCATVPPAPAGCGIAGQPTTLAIASDGRPKLAGALNLASTAAQVLMLEYAEGTPSAALGWGRATASDVARLSRFHAGEFALLTRPLPLARRNMIRLAPLIRDALTATSGPALLVIAGHDTDVASLAGLLDVHWQVPGLAPDDPAPGGALMLERLVDRQGRHVVRVTYRSQTLAQIRALDRAVPSPVPLPIGRCAGGAAACALDRFAALLD